MRAGFLRLVLLLCLRFARSALALLCVRAVPEFVALLQRRRELLCVGEAFFDDNFVRQDFAGADFVATVARTREARAGGRPPGRRLEAAGPAGARFFTRLGRNRRRRLAPFGAAYMSVVDVIS